MDVKGARHVKDEDGKNMNMVKGPIVVHITDMEPIVLFAGQRVKIEIPALNTGVRIGVEEEDR